MLPFRYPTLTFVLPAPGDPGLRSVQPAPDTFSLSPSSQHTGAGLQQFAEELTLFGELSAFSLQLIGFC
jgi:hypothetical protein